MITQFGKRFLTNFVAGNASFATKDLAVGIANNSEYSLSNTNSRLGFEFYRMPVEFGGINIDTSVSPNTYTVIYSATLPSDLAGKINEIGIFPGTRSSINNYDSKFITDFELPFDWSPTPDIDQSNYRVGNSSLVFESNGAADQEYISTIETLDISGYSNFDTISFSFKALDSNLSEIKLRLYSSASNYVEMIFDSYSAGNNIVEKTLSEFVTVGSPDKANITQIGIVISPTSSATSVVVDGLRINDEDTFDPAYGLISRKVLPSEVEKVSGKELIIEYKMDLSFGG